MFGAYWLPFLLTALIIGLLLVAVTIPGKRESTVELVDQKAREEEREKAADVLGAFFWVLFVLLLVLIVVRYIV